MDRKRQKLSLLKVQGLNDISINSKLPPEILAKIFAYFSLNELGRIARVCRKWNAVTRSPLIWKNVSVTLYRHHRSQTEAANNFIKHLPSCVVTINLTFCLSNGRVEPLNFEKFCIRLQSKCPKLQTLILQYAIFSDNLPSIVALCSQFLGNVTNLTLRWPSFTVQSETRECVDTSKIEVLNIYSPRLTDVHKPPFSKMPHLKKLCLNNALGKSNWFEVDFPFFDKLEVFHVRNCTLLDSRGFQILCSHAHNLKELHACSSSVKDSDLNFSKFALPHLETICVNNCQDVTCVGVISLIQSCQSLQNIFVDTILRGSCEKNLYFTANRCKLEIIKVTKLCAASKMWIFMVSTVLCFCLPKSTFLPETWRRDFL